MAELSSHSRSADVPTAPFGRPPPPIRGWNSWLGYCGGAPNETTVGVIAGHLQRQLLPSGFTMLGIELAAGESVIKCRFQSKRVQRYIRLHRFLSMFRFRSALNDRLAWG